MATTKLESAFQRFIDPHCIERLQQLISAKPAILLGGDQLTGKSTMSKKLSSHFSDGAMYSVGTLFRELAAKNSVSVAELSRILLAQLQNPNSEHRFDVDLDYRTCEIIAGSQNPSRYCVIEGRQPAVMGVFLKERLGKQNLFKIYLTCSPRERAIRFIDREFGSSYSQIADKNLPVQHEAYKDFSEIGKLIGQLEMPDKEKIASSFIDNQRRDLDDRARYIDLYGMDYRDLSHYDLVVDTTGKSANDNFEYAISQLKERSPFLWDELKNI